MKLLSFFVILLVLDQSLSDDPAGTECELTREEIDELEVVFQELYKEIFEKLNPSIHVVTSTSEYCDEKMRNITETAGSVVEGMKALVKKGEDKYEEIKELFEDEIRRIEQDFLDKIKEIERDNPLTQGAAGDIPELNRRIAEGKVRSKELEATLTEKRMFYSNFNCDTKSFKFQNFLEANTTEPPFVPPEICQIPISRFQELLDILKKVEDIFKDIFPLKFYDGAEDCSEMWTWISDYVELTKLRSQALINPDFTELNNTYHDIISELVKKNDDRLKQIRQKYDELNGILIVNRQTEVVLELEMIKLSACLIRKEKYPLATLNYLELEDHKLLGKIVSSAYGKEAHFNLILNISPYLPLISQDLILYESMFNVLLDRKQLDSGKVTVLVQKIEKKIQEVSNDNLKRRFQELRLRVQLGLKKLIF